MPHRKYPFMQHVTAALLKSGERKLKIHCTNTCKISPENGSDEIESMWHEMLML